MLYCSFYEYEWCIMAAHRFIPIPNQSDLQYVSFTQKFMEYFEENTLRYSENKLYTIIPYNKNFRDRIYKNVYNQLINSVPFSFPINPLICDSDSDSDNELVNFSELGKPINPANCFLFP